MRSDVAGVLDDKRLEVMGVTLDNVSGAEIEERVIAAARGGQRLLVANANAHMVVLTQTRPWLREFLADADITFCDGAGVQLATLALRGKAIHRTTPTEWVLTVLNALGPEASIFWLGGKPDVVEQAAKMYESRFGVRTAGTQHGFFDSAPGSKESLEVVAAIRAARPNILLVNMSMPLQERWLAAHFAQLPPCVAITGGALVDHAAGLVRRPPRWVANMGLEWLVRLAIEPRRLWRRYLLGLPLFGAYVLRYAVLGRGIQP
jgi:N-acetylglucosaminyldiphosphoundecaprenol N-acetyl-beta-D-mannosaminyltransferase